jgi:hypothetical protein
VFTGADVESDFLSTPSPRKVTSSMLELLDGLVDSLMEIFGEFGNVEANSTKLVLFFTGTSLSYFVLIIAMTFFFFF